MIPKNGLPTRTQRWCCKELKEFGGIGHYCMTGVRWEESANRKKNRALHEVTGKTKEDIIILNNDNDMRRKITELCIPKRKFVLNPIIDWIEDEVWEFIKERNIPYNPLYGLGYKRVGCVGCPMSYNNKRELINHPKYMAAYFRAAKKWIERRIEKGLDHSGIMETPELYFNWWLGRKGK
jgi:phosphoadenosine phosphosulfate reductase